MPFYEHYSPYNDVRIIIAFIVGAMFGATIASIFSGIDWN